MTWARGVPGLGILLALLSGVCFATSGFTIEIMRGTEPKGQEMGVDGCIVIFFRSVACLVVVS